MSAELADIKREVDELLTPGRNAGDPESWHCIEDDLMIRVLRAVVAGSPDAQAMAAEVLRTQEGDHERWYA